MRIDWERVWQETRMMRDMISRMENGQRGENGWKGGIGQRNESKRAKGEKERNRTRVLSLDHPQSPFPLSFSHHAPILSPRMFDQMQCSSKKCKESLSRYLNSPWSVEKKRNTESEMYPFFGINQIREITDPSIG